MDRVFKIVVTGPFNSGKTTFINTISEIEVVSTERNTVTARAEKKKTTVAMDFGRISLPDGYVIHMYGTPGQKRFNFMIDILAEGMLGYVVLVDGSDPSNLGEGKRIVEEFGHMADVPYVVGLTKVDLQGSVSGDQVRKEISALKDAEIIECDARTVEGVKKVLIGLLEKVVERTEAVEKAG